jgi:hypothetical protein
VGTNRVASSTQLGVISTFFAVSVAFSIIYEEDFRHRVCHISIVLKRIIMKKNIWVEKLYAFTPDDDDTETPSDEEGSPEMPEYGDPDSEA